MTGISGVSNTAYVQDALKYINGMNITNAKIQDDVAGAFSSIPSFGVMQGGLFAGGEILKKTTVLDETGAEVSKMAGFKGLFNTLGEIKTTMIGNDALKEILKTNKGLSGASKNVAITKEIKDLIKAGKTGEIQNLIKTANSSDDLVKGISALKEASTAAETTAKVSKLSKLGTWIKSLGPVKTVTEAIGKSGAAKAVKGAGEAIAKVTPNWLKSGASKFGKAFKGSGAGICLALEGVMALVTDVIPAFKYGGFGEGVKQTAKSAVKVGASTAGFVLGDKAGAAIGGAIGTIFGPVGTMVGGIVGGLVGGLIGSAVSGKVAEKIVGEDYTDKMQNEAVEQQSVMIAQDSVSMQQLNAAVQQMIQADMADDGKLSTDSEKMLAYLNAGQGTVYFTGAQQSPYQYQTAYQQDPYSQYAYTTQASSSSELDELLQRVKSGDRSVYDVPADVLNQSAQSYSSQYEGYANNYTNYGYTNPYATTGGTNGQVLNYFEA